jgi:hypothetical protein
MAASRVQEEIQEERVISAGKVTHSLLLAHALLQHRRLEHTRSHTLSKALKA